MDSKAKTNKHKHAYFAGVGVDSFWKNSTLFRSWVPNQTDASYTWLTNVGLQAVVPAATLKKIKSLFTDDDNVVNAGLDALLQVEEIFEAAKAYLCGYHIVRNFHSEFGVNCKRVYKLKSSTTKHRKGGTIQWGHPWQKNCADAIYRLQVCETHEEACACYLWIRDYIKRTKDIGRKSLRQLVLRFFARKFKKREQWILAYRLTHRTLDLKSTSRIEGEFSGVHTMKLTSKMGMQKSFHKLRFYADRRRVKKMRLSQDSVSKTSKKKSPHMTCEEWRFLDQILTPYYCRKVELQAERAKKMEIEFVEKKYDAIIFKVWVPYVEGIEQVGDDVADVFHDALSSSDSDNESSEDQGPDDDESAEDDEGIIPARAKSPSSLNIAKDVSDSEHVSSCSSEGEDDFKPFMWRRVRTVICEKKGNDHYNVTCDCGYMLRTCIICRHILLTISTILNTGEWGFQVQSWHTRLLKKFYYEVLTSLKSVGGSEKVPSAKVPTEAVLLFCSSNNPSTEGIPAPGIFGVDAVRSVMDDCMDGGETLQSERSKALPKPKRKGSDVSNEMIKQKIQTLLYDLKGDAKGKSEFYSLLCQFQQRRGRSDVSAKPGAPERDRTRGVADRRKGESKRKRYEELPSSVQSYRKKKRTIDEDRLYEGDDALRYLKRHGAKQGWILEVYPSDDYLHERWFMEVENGSRKDVAGDTFITSCWWLKTNSLERDLTFKRPASCDIEMVKACGPADSVRL